MLFFTIIIITCIIPVEVFLGIMLLIGYKSIYNLGLLILIVLFSFNLYYFNVVKDCGCFETH
jgi:hypothetical protein